MQLIPISETEVRPRQRSVMDKKALSELKETIILDGLLHPPVFWADTLRGKWVLVAGERRFVAMQQLHAEDRQFKHDGQIVLQGQIPITRVEVDVDEVRRFEIELNENIRREDLSWQDRVKAFSDLHSLRLAQNPRQSNADTAKELADKGLVGSMNTGRAAIAEATVIAKHLGNEKIAKARNPAEAIGLIYKMEEDRITAALVKRQLARLPEASTIVIREGDCLPILSGLDSDMVDLILCDPPYGIDASSAGHRSRTVHHHNYKDTPENAKLIAQTIFTEGFRICKTRANLFMFCDIDLFPWLKLTAKNMGWEPFRRPLIWQKSDSEGLAPWGGQGPRITTEFILYATKGSRGLNASPIDVFDDKRVSRSERIHAAEKPVDLMKKLIQCSTLPGDFILDPCCGSGSALVAAKELKRQALGIELDHDYYNTALSNVFGGDLRGQASSTSSSS